MCTASSIKKQSSSLISRDSAGMSTLERIGDENRHYTILMLKHRFFILTKRLARDSESVEGEVNGFGRFLRTTSFISPNRLNTPHDTGY